MLFERKAILNKNIILSGKVEQNYSQLQTTKSNRNTGARNKGICVKCMSMFWLLPDLHTLNPLVKWVLKQLVHSKIVVLQSQYICPSKLGTSFVQH